MKNKGITLVSLVVTVIVLILLAGVSLNLTLGENGIITIARKAKENTELAQIEEEKMLNELYTQIELDGGFSEGLDYDAVLKLYEFKKVIADAIEEAGGVRPDNTAEAETFKESIKGIVTEVTKDATATDKDILVGKTAWVNGIKVTGSMINQGEITQTLNAGESYTIPEGYHNGKGKITVSSLNSQTDATATAGEILTGKTAWVKGNKITGTMPNQGTINQSLNAGESYTIPAGYHKGSGKVTANSLASQTQATATADNITEGKTAWVNGVLITGTGADVKESIASGKKIRTKNVTATTKSVTLDINPTIVIVKSDSNNAYSGVWIGGYWSGGYGITISASGRTLSISAGISGNLSIYYL